MLPEFAVSSMIAQDAAAATGLKTRLPRSP